MGIKIHESQLKEENLLCCYLGMAGIYIREYSFEIGSRRTFLKLFGAFSGGDRWLIHKRKKKVVIATASLDVISSEFILETVQRNS